MGHNKAVSKKAAPKKAAPKKAAPKVKVAVKQIPGPKNGGKKTNAGVVRPIMIAQQSTVSLAKISEDEKKQRKVLTEKFLRCKDQLERKLARAAVDVDFKYTVKDGVVTIDTKKCAPAGLTGKALDAWATAAMKLKFSRCDFVFDDYQDIFDSELDMFTSTVGCLKAEVGLEVLAKLHGNNSDDDDDDDDGDDDC